MPFSLVQVLMTVHKKHRVSSLQSMLPFFFIVLINYLLNTFLHTPRGVLDPEELCAMNKGFKRRESFLFPGIQEDLKIA